MTNQTLASQIKPDLFARVLQSLQNEASVKERLGSTSYQIEDFFEQLDLPSLEQTESTYLSKVMETFQNSNSISTDTNTATGDGVRLVVEDVRIVLILDDEAVKKVVEGMSIATEVTAEFAAATAAIAAATGLASIAPVSAFAAIIAALAGIFAAFISVHAKFISLFNQGKGVYLTLTVIQLTAAIVLVASAVLAPVFAWMTLPAAAALVVPLPTPR